VKTDYSIVIPVLKLEENPYLDNILSSLATQSLPPKCVLLVVGDKRQGRAINYGVSKLATTYIATVDDDTMIDDVDLFKKLLDAISTDSSIGIAGAACVIPEYASNFQKRAMREIPRRFFPVQKETVDSDMVQHPCLVMPRALFWEIEGEDEELVRGLDPVLRKKVRDAGKRVAIIADTWIYHLIPDGFWKVMRMYYRNGRGSGCASKNYPDRVLELSDGYDGGYFDERKPFFFRMYRRFISLMLSIFKMELIKVSADIAYILGVVREKLLPAYDSIAPAVVDVTVEERSGYPFDLLVHRIELKK
jgi:glycosyltransferase involved in cell wall biosynthesis